MIGLRLSVPIACWRRGAAREFLETEPLPPPATAYGALLAMVGEVDRDRHVGCAITTGIIGQPARSTVLRTLWRVKDRHAGLGLGSNASPDIQELIIQSEVLIFCDSSGEVNPPLTLEQRVRNALSHPEEIERFGGWSLGESTHLINDVWLQAPQLPPESRIFVKDEEGDLTMPVWVDHVGAKGSRHTVGRLISRHEVSVADLHNIRPK